MNWLLIAAVFFAYQYRDKIKAALASKPATDADKPLTVAEAKALFADHGLECKHKPPEIKDNGDGSYTIRPPTTK